jgi:hypothetical protein
MVTSGPATPSTAFSNSSPPRILHDTPVQTRTIRLPGSDSRNSG